jgi:F-type H+-transporting ATPase subunit epsilon
MHLKVLLPFQVFIDKTNVFRIVAETREGSFGLLPQRLDCIAALAPGILTYEIENESEVYVAINEGVLIKTGSDVLVSVRDAIIGKSLEQLRQAVDQKFSILNEQEKNIRLLTDKLESDIVQRLAKFHHKE